MIDMHKIKRIYLDSNVLVSLVREEINGNFRLFYRDSEVALSLCNRLGIKLIISFLFLDEVKNACGLNRQSALEILQKYASDVDFAEESQPSLIKKAYELTRNFGLHRSDSIHAAIAKQYNCDLIMTWNVRDFEKIDVIIKCITPWKFINQLA